MKRSYKRALALFLTGLIGVLATAKASAQNDTVTKRNKIMEQRISFITIGAKDLNKLKQFYIERFKWVPLKDSGGIVFFKMNGFILSLFPADELADDATVSPEGKGFKKFTMAINYQSEKEVDEAFEVLRGRGVRVVKAPQKAAWGGYSGYVADIEDNLWEIAFNPYLEMDTNGNVLTHH